jgi:YbaB/EbfC DNA-binding family
VHTFSLWSLGPTQNVHFSRTVWEYDAVHAIHGTKRRQKIYSSGSCDGKFHGLVCLGTDVVRLSVLECFPSLESVGSLLCVMFGEKANESVNGEAGAGLVKVCATVQGKVTSVAIDKALLAPEKQQVIEDLTVRFRKCEIS